MQKLTDRHGVATVHRALHHLQLRLLSTPETAPLAEEIKAHRVAIREKEDLWSEAHEQRVVASSVLPWLDGQLDAAVMHLSRAVLLRTGNDRRHPHYQRLFAAPPSAGLLPVGGEEERRYVAGILAVLASDPEFGPFAPYAEPIQEALARLTEAERQREALYTPEDLARGALRQAVGRAQRAYNLFLPRLQMLFPDDPAFVETFFLPLRAAAHEDDEVPPVVSP